MVGVLGLLGRAAAWGPSTAGRRAGVEDGAVGRRAFGGMVAAAWLGSGPVRAGAAVVDVARCDSGTGDACDVPDSPLIQDLILKSRQNAASREKANLKRYNINNYKDYFAAMNPPRILVENRELGTFKALTDAEIQAATKAGTVKFDAASWYFVPQPLAPSPAPAAAAVPLTEAPTEPAAAEGTG